MFSEYVGRFKVQRLVSHVCDKTENGSNPLMVLRTVLGRLVLKVFENLTTTEKQQKVVLQIWDVRSVSGCPKEREAVTN